MDVPDDNDPVEVRNFTLSMTSVLQEPQVYRVTMDTYGVVVVRDVFSDDVCSELFSKTLDYFESLQLGMDRSDVNSFNQQNTLVQTRLGMYQNNVANIPAMWQVRKDRNVRTLFAILYGDPPDGGEYLASADGLTLLPNKSYKRVGDWAHLDQVFVSSNMADCYQGQAVLTSCDHCFLCSVKSHLVHSDIVDIGVKEGIIPSKMRNHKGSQFSRLERAGKSIVKDAKQMTEKVGGVYQMPITAPRGSFILWNSKCVHSARRASMPRCDEAPYNGWRLVMYICLRPRREFTAAQILERAKLFLFNQHSGHWVYNKLTLPFRPRMFGDKKDLVEKLTKEPLYSCNYFAKPDLSDPAILELSGLKFCRETNDVIKRGVSLYSSSQDDFVQDLLNLKDSLKKRRNSCR